MQLKAEMELVSFASPNPKQVAQHICLCLKLYVYNTYSSYLPTWYIVLTIFVAVRATEKLTGSFFLLQGLVDGLTRYVWLQISTIKTPLFLSVCCRKMTRVKPHHMSMSGLQGEPPSRRLQLLHSCTTLPTNLDLCCRILAGERGPVTGRSAEQSG